MDIKNLMKVFLILVVIWLVGNFIYPKIPLEYNFIPLLLLIIFLAFKNIKKSLV